MNVHICGYLITVNKKDAVDLKAGKEAYIEEFGGKKGRKNNIIIISKTKEIILKSDVDLIRTSPETLCTTTQFHISRLYKEYRSFFLFT